MDYVPQIIDALNASAVEKILVIDDAYDPPEFDPQFGGALLEILSPKQALREVVTEDLICEKELDDAIDALNQNQLEDSAISSTWSALYQVFLETRDRSIDPGGVFDTTKGPALSVLDPLLELLYRRVDEPQIVRAGIEDAEDLAKCLEPDLIFMDFFMSPQNRTTLDIPKWQSDDDRTRSIELLKSILGRLTDNVPAVVLMSSRNVKDRKEAYLSRLDDRVMALRFGFLFKEWVKGSKESLNASGDAADVLMDTFGSYEFGYTLEKALLQWKVGAEKALDQLYSELREFDVKDFAYLLRFRLYAERERFADYLEWFLGESLRAVADDAVAWESDEFSHLDDRALTQPIEGAHPRPSTRLAKFFHRTRFNSRQSRRRHRFMLGDLFISPTSKFVRMVISPDCDLVRPDASNATKRILTIGGKIRRMHEEEAWAGDLIYQNGPKAIKWNFKDLMTHGFGDEAKLKVDGNTYRFLASMRSMDAQQIQKIVLADLSRVGLPVPPTVDFGAPVKVFLNRKVAGQGRLEEFTNFDQEPRVQVFMPRGGNESKRRILFNSRFVRELIVRLTELDEADLHDDHRSAWSRLISQPEKIRTAMLHDGLELPGEKPFDIVTTIGEPRKKGWLQLVVNISEDALVSVYGVDPFKY